MSESQDDPNWIPRINTNSVYTYLPAYDETYVAYNKLDRHAGAFCRRNYEDENGYGVHGNAQYAATRRILVADCRRFGRTYVRKLLDRQV